MESLHVVLISTSQKIDYFQRCSHLLKCLSYWFIFKLWNLNFKRTILDLPASFWWTAVYFAQYIITLNVFSCFMSASTCNCFFFAQSRRELWKLNSDWYFFNVYCYYMLMINITFEISFFYSKTFASWLFSQGTDRCTRESALQNILSELVRQIDNLWFLRDL